MSITGKQRRTIFAHARELGLDDDERKELQLQVTGKDSTSSMTSREAAQMIDHLRKLCGPGRRQPKYIGRVPRTLKREPMLQKIEAQLTDMGLSWDYAESIAWRITGGTGENRRDGCQQPGVARLEWVRSERDLRAVIAALHVEQQKRDGLAHIQSELHRLGKDEVWLLNQIPAAWADKWKRNTTCMGHILDLLAEFDDKAGGNCNDEADPEMQNPAHKNTGQKELA